MTAHIPVLTKEVISGLNLKSGDNVVDCTLGGGGHARAILEATAPNGKLLGIDWDKEAVKNTSLTLKEYKDRIILKTGNYQDIKTIAYESGFNEISAILLDLGLSTDQLADQSRGFSFSSQGPLDMRFSDQEGLTAGQIVNTWSEKELAHIFRIYGEERHATRIAHLIIAARQSAPITSVPELVTLVTRGAGRHGRQRIHPATRIFQALRLATNHELENVANILPIALSLLMISGRLGVISFHSLEDRIVKQFFQAQARGCICPSKLPVCRCDHKPSLRIINKKVITATEEEIDLNPSSRSAKLRLAEKI